MKIFWLASPWFLWSFGITALAAEVPPVASLRSLSYAGTACPANSLFGRFSADRNQIDINSNGIVVESGPGIPLSDSRKVCQISMDIERPAGWSYAIVGLKSTMYVSLDRGQSLDFLLRSYTSAPGSYQVIAHALIQGPLQADTRVENYVDVQREPLLWSSCVARRATNVQMQVRLASRFPARGFLNIPNESIEDETFHLQVLWRRCS